MEMEMGGGARAMGLMDFGPEGVGVGEKRATVVRRAILAEAAMTDRSFAARRANGGRGWADDNEETSTLQQAAEKAFSFSDESPGCLRITQLIYLVYHISSKLYSETPYLISHINFIFYRKKTLSIFIYFLFQLRLFS
jgi:hypothetical protein